MLSWISSTHPSLSSAYQTLPPSQSHDSPANEKQPYESQNQPVPEVTTTQDAAPNPTVVSNESTILTGQKLVIVIVEM